MIGGEKFKPLKPSKEAKKKQSNHHFLTEDTSYTGGTIPCIEKAKKPRTIIFVLTANDNGHQVKATEHHRENQTPGNEHDIISTRARAVSGRGKGRWSEEKTRQGVGFKLSGKKELSRP